MPAMRIQGVPPWDGDYPLDVGRAFSGDEWEWITTLSGYLPPTLRTGFENRDPRLFIALSLVGLGRAGKIDKRDWRQAADDLMAVPFDWTVITLIATDHDVEAVDEIPLDSTPPQDEQSPTGSLLKSA